ncbi:metallophosphoesterase [Ureibacillus sp. FSL K6-8385]|uniref:Biotin transporter BioY n=1 Tax=Ureibacillus terrenus TaxID=118246 RepID=A0A540V5Z2_9BACL|nr:metallophosphoesterase [Ureibacillus terrenus]MED3660838.1 metallophosphoesterase [Ureibacillus terrenus]MED3763026.1 metallophosphoesterase [Ureibacillus terrenus]TQE92176.1 biotin transporter BioY [Ureibacillus terrenus]
MLFIEIDNGVDIVGDIHACFDEWMEMLDKLGYRKNEQGLFIHPEGRKIVSLGDVMSRGPRSIETMQFFLKHCGKNMYMVDSNHGWKIARWLDGRKVQLKHGDEKVAEEFIEFEKKYGKERTVRLKRQLRDLFMNLPSHIILRDHGQPKVVCVHAGIREDFIGKESERIKNFCRYGDVAGMDRHGKPIRREWYKQYKGELMVVWGHDPKPEPLVINNTINIDQGVVFGGKLTAFRYPEKEFVFVPGKKDYAGSNDNPFTGNN